MQYKYKGKELRVIDLMNFSKTAIYIDEQGGQLRNGNTPMIAMYMALFA